jgi:predicted ATPase/DNA-binding CsgD family transcriptional regulator
VSEPSAQPTHAPALTPIRPRPALPDLPVPLTRLIGREWEVAAVVALLQLDDVRLLTLVGPGGVGKTRLALQAAVDLSDVFPDGIGFVPLAAIRDPDFVLFAVAQGLGFQDMGTRPLGERLAAFLRSQRILLVLDNFEHLLDATPQLALLLSACPRLKLLVTSRTVLRLSGEHTLPVPPLALPLNPAPSLDEVASSEAVGLFLARARASRPDFALTETNAAAVAAISRRLDGLPLAIELAAARLAHLPLPGLLRRLEQRLPLLTGGPCDLPARQRTMRNAIAWSYELLTPDEQTLFRRLAVFVDGFTLGAAAAITGVMERTDGTILDSIAALVDQSLVQTVEGPNGEPRYQILETVREFGLERLTDSGEAKELSRRHAHYFLALAQQGAVALMNTVQGSWLNRLEAEQANLRSALGWLRDQGESAAGLRLAAMLGSFWHIRSANTEGRAWLETFLALTGDDEAPTMDRIVALRWAGELAGLQGDLTTAETCLRESLALARQAGDTCGIAAALRAFGSAVLQHGDVAGSLAPLKEAAALTRELGDLRQTAFLLAYVAYAVGHQGDLTRAEALAAESVELVHSSGDVQSFETDFVEFVQGWLAIMGGDYDRARCRLEAALALGQAIAAKATLSAILGGLGEVALVKGEADVASQHYHEGLVLGFEGDFRLGIALNLQGLVRLGTRSGELVPIARVVGALDAFAGTIRALPPLVTDQYEADVAKVRMALGEEVFSAARAAGHSLRLQDAISEAMALPVAPVVAPTEAPPAAASMGLSPRELDVLRMVAAGHSDQAIADALFVSRRTVNTHVGNILSKLGAPSRSAAVAVAVRRSFV